jgi:sortase A
VAGWSTAAVMFGVGAWLLFSVGSLEWNFHTVGADLESHIQSVIAHSTSDPTACATSSGSGAVTSVDGFGLAGNLVAPSISLNAPVVEGIGSAQLAVAVGHDPSSAWPSTNNTSVLSGHDVTWFSGLGHLQAGDEVDYLTACRAFQYIVISSRVVKAGTPLPSTNVGRLALVTCYPLNALYVTSNRLVVEAELVSVRYHPEGISTPETFVIPTVPAPPALAHQGLDIDDNAATVGSLEITGTPAPTWSQSDAPLGTHVAVLALFFGALRSAEQNQPGWWSALSPGVPFGAAQSLVGTGPATSDITDSTIQVRGTTVLGATLSATVQVPEAKGGTYQVTMSATVQGGAFEITAWQLSKP